MEPLKPPIEKNEKNTDSKAFESVNIKTEIKEEVKIKEENQNFDSDYKFDHISKASMTPALSIISYYFGKFV